MANRSWCTERLDREGLLWCVLWTSWIRTHDVWIAATGCYWLLCRGTRERWHILHPALACGKTPPWWWFGVQGDVPCCFAHKKRQGDRGGSARTGNHIHKSRGQVSSLLTAARRVRISHWQRSETYLRRERTAPFYNRNKLDAWRPYEPD